MGVDPFIKDEAIQRQFIAMAKKDLIPTVSTIGTTDIAGSQGKT